MLKALEHEREVSGFILMPLGVVWDLISESVGDHGRRLGAPWFLVGALVLGSSGVDILGGNWVSTIL